LLKTPNDSLVSVWGILLVMLFLLTLTVVLLYQIRTSWPSCELTQEVAAVNDNQNGNANGNSNTNSGNANGNTISNANANGNANGNVNGNANGNIGAANNQPVGRTPPVTTESPAPVVREPEPSAATAPGPRMRSVEPKSGSIKGGTLVIIKGEGFGPDDVIAFDGKPATRTKDPASSTESISVRTPYHEEGAVDVTLHRDKKVLDVLRGEYTYVCPVPSGSSLFLMIIMAGALGGCIHALRSLYWYAGHGELKWRWLPMYFVLPFTGAATAMIFSLLIVAGFVSNTTGRGESLFIIAVAGLVGMFSQQAALKLTDIANAFFTKPGEGKDAAPQESQSVGAGPAKTTLTATEMSANSGTAADAVTITGTGFNDATTVNFGDLPAEITTVTPTSLTVTPPDQPAGKAVDVTVKSGSQTVKLPTQFTYN
jgi:hypothetical protein